MLPGMIPGDVIFWPEPIECAGAPHRSGPGHAGSEATRDEGQTVTCAVTKPG
jgi:hypothetical protein